MDVLRVCREGSGRRRVCGNMTEQEKQMTEERKALEEELRIWRGELKTSKAIDPDLVRTCERQVEYYEKALRELKEG